MFNIDWQLLITRLLPPFLRQVGRVTWLFTLLKPLRDTYDAFIQFRTNTLLSLSFNGQTIVLNRLLNMNYPNPGDGIYIDDSSDRIIFSYFFRKSESQSPTYFYRKAEGQPPFYLFRRAEITNQYDFIVYVPSFVVFTEAAMRALLNKYVIAGKQYKIQTY